MFRVFLFFHFRKSTVYSFLKVLFAIISPWEVRKRKQVLVCVRNCLKNIVYNHHTLGKGENRSQY